MEIFKLVSHSATPEQWKEWLQVPLEHAAARGNLDLFNKLLGAGANGSAGWRGCRDRTLLDAAAVGGNEDVVSGLLRVGAQPDVNVVSCSSKRSALYTATMLGHEAVARRLIVAGSDVNVQDPMHKTSVLYEATWDGHEQLTTELLISGANPNCRAGVNGVSPLHAAAYRGLDGVVSTLLLRGADKDALDHDGRTPLIWASDQGHLSVVNTLLASGADATIRDTEQFSALDYAARAEHGDVIEAIVGHGADVNARHDDTGFTTLHNAAGCDQAGAVDTLIEAGADAELKATNGQTPLAVTAYHTSCKSMLALLQHGAKVDVRADLGNTPLHEACLGLREGLHAVVDLLLRWGADETALNDDGESPAALLDVKEDEDVDNPSTQDEIDRTRLLVAHAPADRAWRRRGWLVMLRSRAEKARVAGSCGSDSQIKGDDPGVADGRREGEGCKAARTEPTGTGADHVVRRKTGTDVGASGGHSKGEILSGVVGMLVGMEPEGVFRTIVGGEDVQTGTELDPTIPHAYLGLQNGTTSDGTGGR